MYRLLTDGKGNVVKKVVCKEKPEILCACWNCGVEIMKGDDHHYVNHEIWCHKCWREQSE